MPSTASMRVTVRPSTCKMARGLARPRELLTARRSTSEIWRPSRRRVSTVVTRNPSPPNCISSRITHWPSRVKAVLVVTTVSPVTAAAEVEVNKASRRLIGCVVIQGRRSSSVPMPISVASADDQAQRDGQEALALRVERFLRHLGQARVGVHRRSHGRAASFQQLLTRAEHKERVALLQPGRGVGTGEQAIRTLDQEHRNAVLRQGGYWLRGQAGGRLQLGEAVVGVEQHPLQHVGQGQRFGQAHAAVFVGEDHLVDADAQENIAVPA